MRRKISKIVSLIKNEEWNLDNNIPVLYLLNFFMIRCFMLIKGFIVFFSFKGIVMIGRYSKIRARALIKIEKSLTIERNCYIDALSVNGIKFGSNVTVGKNTTIECTGSLKYLGVGLIVGRNTGLGSHGYWGCAGGVEVGDNTICGNFVSVHSENHIYNDSKILIRLQGVTRKGIKIGSNCWIGAKVTILDGVSIGDGCVIAAGSVLLGGEYPSNAIYGGVPAKYLKSRFN